MNHLSGATAQKVVNLSNAIRDVQTWQNQNEKVVFTNGCFDILHVGHVDYLEKASTFGSKMIIGLNNDDSVRRLKGDDRPIMPGYARARILAALAFVDAVVLFSEDTPYQLINALQPDVLVKGSDYDAKKIVGADVVLTRGGTVETVEIVTGHSSTLIVNKIRSEN